MPEGLSRDIFDDPRKQRGEENLTEVLKWISLDHVYDDRPQTVSGSNYTDNETGPGTLVLTLSRDSILENIEDHVTVRDSNAFDETETMYLDGDNQAQPLELYENILETCESDGAIVVSGNGRIYTENMYLEPPENVRDEASITLEMGAKRIAAVRMSALDEVAYSKTLSATTGNISTYVDGEVEDVMKREEFKDPWAALEE